MSIVKGRDFGVELCKAIGIDPAGQRVLSVTVRADVRDLVTADVKLAVTHEQADAVERLVKAQTWILAKEEAP